MGYPRIDYLAFDRTGRTHTIRGTPTEGATLDNELGIAPLPEGFTEVRNEFGEPVRILVADASASLGPQIRDRRPWTDAARRKT